MNKPLNYLHDTRYTGSSTGYLEYGQKYEVSGSSYSDMGVFGWVGTNKGTRSYVNPCGRVDYIFDGVGTGTRTTNERIYTSQDGVSLTKKNTSGYVSYNTVVYDFMSDFERDTDDGYNLMILPRGFTYTIDSGSTSGTSKIIASRDGVTFTTLKTFSTPGSYAVKYETIETSNYYRYLGIEKVSGSPRVFSIEFFGSIQHFVFNKKLKIIT